MLPELNRPRSLLSREKIRVFPARLWTLFRGWTRFPVLFPKMSLRSLFSSRALALCLRANRQILQQRYFGRAFRFFAGNNRAVSCRNAFAEIPIAVFATARDPQIAMISARTR